MTIKQRKAFKKYVAISKNSASNVQKYHSNSKTLL